MYFKRFPEIFYAYDVNGETTLKVVRDITANIRFRKELFSNITLYDEYDIKEGETPDILADRVYGDSKYHWVIMIFNDRYNLATDWPMSSKVLDQYIINKYGEGIYNTHHWEKDGFVVNADTFQAIPVSNYKYEEDVNDKKRRIKLISTDMLSSIVNQYKTLI